MIFDIERNIVLSLILIFCRVAPIFTLLPGGVNIPPYVKIALAIIFSIIVSDVVKAPLIMDNYILGCISETLIGTFIGLVLHLLFMTIHTAGGMISMMSGMSMASIFDTTISASNPLIAKVLSTIFMALFFATDMHLTLLKGIITSYEILNYNALMFGSDDFIEYIILIIEKTFELALKISAPIIAISLLIYISIGIINKMIPYIQIFFIFVPLHVWLSLFVIFLYLSNIFVWFSAEFLFIMNELMVRGD